MASGIRIPFVADVRDWLRGTRTVRDDLDDIERGLDDVADSGRDSARDLERGFTDASRDIEDSFRDVERSGRDSARDLERGFESSGDDIERVFSDIERDAEQALDDIERKASSTDIAAEIGKSNRRGKMAEVGAELGDELSENLGEGFRSGDMASVVTESLTSLAPALGVVGIAIGGIAGLAGGIIRGTQQATENITNAASSLFGQIVDAAEEQGWAAADAFRTGYLDNKSIDTGLEQLFGTMEEGWRKVQERTLQTGVAADTVALAYLGNADALDVVETAIEDNNAAYQRVRDEQGRVKDSDFARYLELEDQADALDVQKRALVDIKNKGVPLLEQNKQNAETYRVRRNAIRDISNTRPPDFESLEDALKSGASYSDTIRWNLNNMPTQHRYVISPTWEDTRPAWLVAAQSGRPLWQQDGYGP
jgi:hypothetical protein